MGNFIVFLFFLIVWFPFSQSLEKKKEKEIQTFAYIGGEFSAHLGKDLIEGIGLLSNDTWTSLPNAPKSVGRVNFIVSNGSNLYIGGKFKEVANIDANSIVVYDSLQKKFSSLCGGVYGEVLWVELFGSQIYLGGDFHIAEDCQGEPLIVNNVAAFDINSKTWTSFNFGTSFSVRVVSSLAVTEINKTRYIYAVGKHEGSGIPFISRWDDKMGWIDIDGTTPEECQNEYKVIAANNQDVYVGGTFRTIGNGEVLNSIAKLNQTTGVWEPLGEGVRSGSSPSDTEQVEAIEFTKDGQVVVAGYFIFAGSAPGYVNNIAIWDGDTWRGLSNGVTGLIFNSCDVTPAYVKDLNINEDQLYVTGRFSKAGNLQVNNIATYSFTNQTWNQVGNDTAFKGAVLYTNTLTPDGNLFVIGQSQVVFDYSEFQVDSIIFSQYNSEENWKNLYEDALESFLDSGKIHSIVRNGTEVYIGGKFITVGGQIIHNVAKWDGKDWYRVGEGIKSGFIYALDIEGDYLYIGGNFNYTTSKGNKLISIARWNAIDQEYYSLGDGIHGDCDYNNSIYVIKTTKEYVYVGGSFLSLGNTSPNVARWNIDNSKWERIGDGITTGYVHAFVLNNTQLFVGGRFCFQKDNLTSDNLIIWDIEKEIWIPLGASLTSSVALDTGILALALNGSSIWIGGSFESVNEVQALNVARLENNLWQPVGLGLTIDKNGNEIAITTALAYDRENDIMLAGGIFSKAGQIAVSNFAQWDGKKRDWTAINKDISSWDGPVFVIHIFCQERVISDKSNPFGFLTLKLIIILGSSFLGASLISCLIFFLVLKRRKRDNYILLPQYPPEEKMSLQDLANDANIKQIPEEEITLGKRIALGVSGEVIKGMWQGKAVAIKRMSLATEKQKEDFIYETKIMSSLKHENILKFLGTSINPSGEVFLVMEFMENGSVRDLLDKTAGKVDWKLKMRLAIDAARGMEYLHNCNPPIIHRDLKSSNLLIDKKWKCVIADFGISRLRSTTQYNTLTLTGTPAYMAPEVISSNSNSEKADVYSFGVVLVELYTGDPPYSSSNLFPQQVMYMVVHEGLRPEIPEDCPMSLQVLINDCLDINPEKRPDFKEIKMRLKRM